MTTEHEGIFTDQDKGRMGVLTRDSGMARLADALETRRTVMSPDTSDRDLLEKIHANEYLIDFVTRLSGLVLDSALPEELKGDLDLRDDIRWQIRPSIYKGLYAGQLLARSLVNG